MGWLGDVVLANLTPNAVQSVTPRTYRLRLLKGSNDRIYRLAFVTGKKQLKFTVIGTDGGLIERPETVTEEPFSPQANASMSCWTWGRYLRRHGDGRCTDIQRELKDKDLWSKPVNV